MLDMVKMMPNTVAIICLSCLGVIAASGMVEYCEEFDGKCEDGEVIRIKSAVYGRMEVGKCIKDIQGPMNCSKDVLDLVGTACSGKQDCKYNVGNSELKATQPCKRGWKSHLKIAYECVPVLTTDAEVCMSSPPVPLKPTSGFISSEVARRSGCGSMSQPWMFNVMPGQRVNVTLLTFNRTQVKSTINRKCKALGYIAERGHRNNVTICSKNGGSEHIYTSNGRHVDIALITYGTHESEPDFLLQYKVFGCPDVQVPPFSWYKREGDVTTIGCERNDRMWTLTCNDDNEWTGSVGSCPDSAAASRLQGTSDAERFDLRMVTLISIGSGCVIFITLVGAVWVTRMRNRPRDRAPSTILLQAQGQEFS